MRDRGWSAADFIIITGDAYVDHPSFGAAIIGRVLESRGYKTAVIAQPRSDKAFTSLGAPRLGFMITSGNLDSMVNHYTVAKKRREYDYYSPGGRTGLRPDRALTVYSKAVRRLFPGVPVILGGLEASLRRLGHYDYWSDSILPSVLADSGADLIIYGMGERAVCEVAEALAAGIPVSRLTYIKGTVFKTSGEYIPEDTLFLPPFPELSRSKKCYAKSFLLQYQNTDAVTGVPLAEYCGSEYIIQNPPAAPLTRDELDEAAALPYTRAWHPVYKNEGGVPAINEVKFSLQSSRGCFGGCNFCALSFHQGRAVTSRSHESLAAEAELLVRDPEFKGYIHDVGGPTANFRTPSCQRQLTEGICRERLCLTPSPCPRLEADHSDYLTLLRRLRRIPGIKKVFIRSGIRFDYLIYDKNDEFLRELCSHHVSGQLKVAPEHISENALKYMGKPPASVYKKFAAKFKEINEGLGKKQYLVPYLMSSHPGCTLQDAVELAEYLKLTGHRPEQVQDFYPTPGTLSACMYYTGLDPRTGEEIFVAKKPRDKAMQRALIQFTNPRNRDLVREALEAAGRRDLIGYGRNCLIKPDRAR